MIKGNLKLLIRYLFQGIFLIFLAFTACQSPPEYSNVPFILFRDIEEVSPRIMKVSIYFEDGNADLGLNNFGDDILPPFNPGFSVVAAKNEPCRYLDTVDFAPLNPLDTVDYFIAKTLYNPSGNNYHLKLYIKKGEKFELVPYGVVQLDPNCTVFDTIFMPEGRFRRLGDDIKDEPIDGTLDLTVNLQASPVSATDTFQFEISIFDRSLNQSNVIRTEPYSFIPQ
jgi:hypothetical protein